MQDYLDRLGKEISAKRKSLNLTQQQVADKLNMSVRTIIQIENGNSNPKFETIVLVARELNISLDSVVFPNANPNPVAKCVVDFFADKTDTQTQNYIALCSQIEKMNES